MWSFAGGIDVVPVARINISNTSNLTFTYEDGVTDNNLWPRKSPGHHTKASPQPLPQQHCKTGRGTGRISCSYRSVHGRYTTCSKPAVGCRRLASLEIVFHSITRIRFFFKFFRWWHSLWWNAQFSASNCEDVDNCNIHDFGDWRIDLCHCLSGLQFCLQKHKVSDFFGYIIIYNKVVDYTFIIWTSIDI